MLRAIYIALRTHLSRSGGNKTLNLDRDEVEALPRSGGKTLNIDRDEVSALPKSGRKPIKYR